MVPIAQPIHHWGRTYCTWYWFGWCWTFLNVWQGPWSWWRHSKGNGRTCYTGCPIKRRKHISTFQSLYASINVGTEKVTIDPLTLFIHLIVLVERKRQNETVDHFRYEMAPYPMALFKDGIMRTAKKSKLKQLLMENVNSVEAPQTVRIVDGGTLLWLEKGWDIQKNIQDIFSIPLAPWHWHHSFWWLQHVGKDSTHQKRGGKKSQTVEIRKGNSCPSNRSTFFSNYSNKENFVKALGSHLETNFKIVQYPSDADTSVVKETMEGAEHSDITVFSDDTDVLCLLVHHNKILQLITMFTWQMWLERRISKENISEWRMWLKNLAIILLNSCYSSMSLQVVTQPQQFTSLVKLAFSKRYQLHLPWGNLLLHSMKINSPKKSEMCVFDSLSYFIHHQRAFHRSVKQSMNKWLHLIVQPLIPLSFHHHREQPFTTGWEFTIKLKFGEIWEILITCHSTGDGKKTDNHLYL